MTDHKPKHESIVKIYKNRSKVVQENTTNQVKTKPQEEKLDPVRYGDWEVKGRCIDF